MSHVSVRFLGHSAVAIEHDGTTVLIDPFLTGNPSAAVRAGMQNTTATETVSELHRKSGIRSMDIPGARNRRIVTIRLTAPAVVEIPRKSRPNA